MPFLFSILWSFLSFSLLLEMAKNNFTDFIRIYVSESKYEWIKMSKALLHFSTKLASCLEIFGINCPVRSLHNSDEPLQHHCKNLTYRLVQVSLAEHCQVSTQCQVYHTQYRLLTCTYDFLCLQLHTSIFRYFSRPRFHFSLHYASNSFFTFEFWKLSRHDDGCALRSSTVRYEFGTRGVWKVIWNLIRNFVLSKFVSKLLILY
jgi:hypothetical protein